MDSSDTLGTDQEVGTIVLNQGGTSLPLCDQQACICDRAYLAKNLALPNREKAAAALYRDRVYGCCRPVRFVITSVKGSGYWGDLAQQLLSWPRQKPTQPKLPRRVTPAKTPAAELPNI